MTEILGMLQVLAILMGINILLGTYDNVKLEKNNFDIKTLLTGVVKAGIIGVSAIGLSYCIGIVDLSQIGVTPELIVGAANITYAGKALTNLAKCLGIDFESLKK